MKEFNRNDSIKLIYDFVLMQDDKGFENNNHKFEILSPGFPPKVL